MSIFFTGCKRFEVFCCLLLLRIFLLWCPIGGNPMITWILYPYLLPSRHDVANAVQYVAGAVGEALEVLPAGYTA